MEPIAATDPLSHSADLTAENIERLRELFPQAVTEEGQNGKTARRIDFDVLRELLGGELATGEEKYGLNWHGKRAGRRLALTPSTGTLRPAPEDSVDWDTTQNLMIEGDNLEVLKLLQKSYAGKVKMIYIDPPYNTGKDFVYKDDFKDSIGNYQRIIGQRDAEGVKLTTNAESSGRFHTDWLNLMYPRLTLARNLLSETGVIAVSCDDNEAPRLRELLESIFGSENFLAQVAVVSNPRGRQSDVYFATVHDYMMFFARQADECIITGAPLSNEQREDFDLTDEKGTPYRLLGLRQRGSASRRIDRPDMFFPIYVNPQTLQVSIEPKAGFTEKVLPRKSSGEDGRWMWGREKSKTDCALLVARKIERRHQFDIFVKDSIERNGAERFRKLKTIWSDKFVNNQAGTQETTTLMSKAVFSFPKSVEMLEMVAFACVEPGETTLDFFSGSGSSAHAVMNLNSRDNGRRRFIAVQLPEPLDAERTETMDAARFLQDLGHPQNIAELTKERLRRASIKIKEDNPLFHGDLGFRVFKLDTTSIRPWDPSLPVTEQRLLGEVDNILPGRTEQDLLYELLLKRGLELTVPIVERAIAGKRVYAVTTGDMIACLAPHIESADVEALAEGIVTWHKELAPPPAIDPNAPLEKPAKFDPPLVVFRDTAFADDVAKSNLTEILKQHSLTDVRSL